MPINPKIWQRFLNLKTDAQPQPPQELPRNFVNFDTRDYELDDDHKDKTKSKPRPKKEKKTSTPSPPPSPPPSYPKPEASGNILNIVNSNHVHIGNTFTNVVNTPSPTEDPYGYENAVILTSAIETLFTSNVTPEHIHLDCVARNLGRRWRSFFRHVGYTDGHIETVEEEESSNGVQEIRYKLLLDWKQSDKEGTLGALARALWTHGHRAVVQELATMKAPSCDTNCWEK